MGHVTFSKKIFSRTARRCFRLDQFGRGVPWEILPGTKLWRSSRPSHWGLPPTRKSGALLHHTRAGLPPIRKRGSAKMLRKIFEGIAARAGPERPQRCGFFSFRHVWRATKSETLCNRPQHIDRPPLSLNQRPDGRATSDSDGTWIHANREIENKWWVVSGKKTFR